MFGARVLPKIGRRPRELNGHFPFLTVLGSEPNNATFPLFPIGYVRQKKLLAHTDVRSEGKQPTVGAYLQCRCFFVKRPFAGRVSVHEHSNLTQEALATSPLRNLCSLHASCGSIYSAAGSFSPQSELG
jgi:hypothetical protein